MKEKWLLAVLVILGCVYLWDASRKSVAEAVIDDVYLNLGTLPDGNNRAFIEKADKQIRTAYVTTLVFDKRKIGKAADMISAQRSSLERYLEDLRTASDDNSFSMAGVNSPAQVLRDLYASGVANFKRDLEYIRRGL